MTLTPPLLAIAHGSRDPRAAATVAELLDLLRRRAARAGLPGLEVATAYLDHAAPSAAQVLGALHGQGARAVVVLPLLLTDAYHSKTDIPAVLRAASMALPGLRIRYGATLGPDPLLIRAMERRLAEAGTRCGEPGTAVVVAAAGSADPAASAVISRLARDWQALRGWQAVRPAFASGSSPGVNPGGTAPVGATPSPDGPEPPACAVSGRPPTPAEAVATLRLAGAKRVVVASYLLASGVCRSGTRDVAGCGRRCRVRRDRCRARARRPGAAPLCVHIRGVAGHAAGKDRLNR